MAFIYLFMYLFVISNFFCKLLYIYIYIYFFYTLLDVTTRTVYMLILNMYEVALYHATAHTQWMFYNKNEEIKDIKKR